MAGAVAGRQQCGQRQDRTTGGGGRHLSFHLEKEPEMKTLLAILGMTAWALAATPEEEGRAIAEKSDAQFRGFVDESMSATMHLISAKGDTVSRRTVNMTLERPNAEDYSLIQFLDPPDVKGTGLLTYQNPKGDDQQWLYLPELRRVKKISSKNKSGAFMGSEFAYEDITGNTLDKFKYKKMGEEKLNGVDCYVIEKVPTYENSGYTKIKQWFSKENYLPQRAEFTDRKNSLLKVQTVTGFKQYGNCWRFEGFLMENLQTKKKSAILFSDRKLGQGLKEDAFTQRSLQRLIR
jgi:outer membrane lipoprotein-sorting protein